MGASVGEGVGLAVGDSVGDEVGASVGEAVTEAKVMVWVDSASISRKTTRRNRLYRFCVDIMKEGSVGGKGGGSWGEGPRKDGAH